MGLSAGTRLGPYEIVATPYLKAPTDWSAKDGSLLYMEFPKVNTPDIRLLPAGADAKPKTLVPAPSGEGRLSPDGRWLVYNSSNCGSAYQLCVVSFPSMNGKWQIITAGGAQPRWSRDGKEIFYISPDERLMRIPVHSGATFTYGPPEPLFQTRITNPSFSWHQYDVSPDGRRFLINTQVQGTSAPITLMTNWTAALKK